MQPSRQLASRTGLLRWFAVGCRLTNLPPCRRPSHACVAAAFDRCGREAALRIQITDVVETDCPLLRSVGCPVSRRSIGERSVESSERFGLQVVHALMVGVCGEGRVEEQGPVLGRVRGCPGSAARRRSGMRRGCGSRPGDAHSHVGPSHPSIGSAVAIDGRRLCRHPRNHPSSAASVPRRAAGKPASATSRPVISRLPNHGHGNPRLGVPG